MLFWEDEPLALSSAAEDAHAEALLAKYDPTNCAGRRFPARAPVDTCAGTTISDTHELKTSRTRLTA